MVFFSNFISFDFVTAAGVVCLTRGHPSAGIVTKSPVSPTMIIIPTAAYGHVVCAGRIKMNKLPRVTMTTTLVNHLKQLSLICHFLSEYTSVYVYPDPLAGTVTLRSSKGHRSPAYYCIHVCAGDD